MKFLVAGKEIFIYYLGELLNLFSVARLAEWFNHLTSVSSVQVVILGGGGGEFSSFRPTPTSYELK